MEQLQLRTILSSKFDFNQWQLILSLIFAKIEYFTSEVAIDASLIKSGGQIGNIRLDDGRSLAIFKFEVADNINISRNRKGLRDIAAHYVDQSLIHGAWVFYYSQKQQDYRLTYIAKQTFFSPDGKLIKNETAPKRYTFLLGENEICTTAASRLYELITKKKKGTVYLTDVTEAFSVERLNKEFFSGYKSHYMNFLAYMKNDSKDNRDYVKKLLGRLVFLQFLQKKGWMGVPADNKGWNGGDKNYLSNLVGQYKGTDRLLSDILEPLFFETLNEPRTGDIANPILGENIKIPYLNGGLFDRDRLDLLNLNFPNAYFEDLMMFFSMYNFTIDENDPDDAEVGIDPEMLGHIFESLLEDNKDKGAFYTPKEIVQYMSRKSIIQYLKTHTNENLHPSIELLVKSSKVSEDLQEKATAIEVNSLLQNVKVCDPAIGSGAFPMGVLNVLFHCRQLLYGFMYNKEDFSLSAIKREIIQENIFGVDIEQGAVDIARLRFWLSLVVDENEPHPLPNLDYKIMCGNSIVGRYGLDEHINNIFVEYNKQHKNDKVTLQSFKELVRRYTNTSSHEDKVAYRSKIEDIKKAFKTELDKDKILKRQKLENMINELEGLTIFGKPSEENIKEAKELRKDLIKMLQEEQEVVSNLLYKNSFEWRFEFPSLLDSDGNFEGFDVVIGNPPYNEIRDLDKSEQNRLKTSRYYDFAKGGRLNIYQFFYPLSIDIAKQGGIISLITQNSILAESSAINNRKLFFSNTDILSIDSYPERDNKNTRVFESAKMSVCICTLKKERNPSESKIIPITVWHSKFMTGHHCLNITKKKISQIYPGDFILPVSSNEKFELLQDLITKGNFQIQSYAGEIDMTKYKSEFSVKKEGLRVITGAQILRYKITDYPSQGEVLYLRDEVLSGLSAKRIKEVSSTRIVLQRITGVDSRIRIIATLIDGNNFCANSTNYIPVYQDTNGLYLLGIINSALINFFVKQTSTNTNITTSVLDSLPIRNTTIENQNAISCLVEYILLLKRVENISKLVTNQYIIDYFEKIIDACVYELYFPEHMKEREINILDDMKERIQPINNFATNLEKANVIWDVFNNIKKTDNPIRNRLELFAIRSPEILKIIIEE